MQRLQINLRSFTFLAVKPGVAGRRLSPAERVCGRQREIPAFAGMTFDWSQREASPSHIIKQRVMLKATYSEADKCWSVSLMQLILMSRVGESEA